jgi:hypothetical protein
LTPPRPFEWAKADVRILADTISRRQVNNRASDVQFADAILRLAFLYQFIACVGTGQVASIAEKEPVMREIRRRLTQSTLLAKVG